MKINANLTKRAVVDTEHMEWKQSPAKGVWRKMLDRDGGEIARATSLVRYAPHSSFPEHVHEGGEEFFVLEGTFSDENGDYPAGTYVRNPIDSRHSPHSDDGCVILVKLRQMNDPDEPRVVVDTTERQWTKVADEPVERIDLFRSELTGEWVCLERWLPHTHIPARRILRGAEVFVLDGAFADEERTYAKGTWLRLPAGSVQARSSARGCTLWVKRGHLR